MSDVSPVPPQYREQLCTLRIAQIAQSFQRFLGKPLVDNGTDIVRALWDSPAAVLAHGTEADPVFFFGNAAALRIFECDVDQFTAMPSRLSAEAPLRDERQSLLERVSANGYIDDYAGMRITATGRRFRIERAIVWNLVDTGGVRQGQAATFVY